MQSKCEGLWNCIHATFAPQIWALLQVVAIYFGLIAGFAVFSFLTQGVKREGLIHELGAFVEDYKDTPLWWITSLTASIIALTIGSGPGLLVDVAVLSVFFFPAMYYFSDRYPFSLYCDYRATRGDGRTDYGRTVENIAQVGPHGECEIELQVQTGSSVDEFCFRLESPDGVSPRNIPTKVAGIELEDNLITGKASPGVGHFSFDLFLEKDGNIVSGRNLLLIKDDESGRTLETIRIMDNNIP